MEEPAAASLRSVGPWARYPRVSKILSPVPRRAMAVAALPP